MAHPSGQQDFAPGMEKTASANSPVLQDSSSSDLEIGYRSTNIPIGAVADLSQHHRDYLLNRHGTLDLDPVPSDDPADPYNWPERKKMANLIIVGFHVSDTRRLPSWPMVVDTACSRQ